jgi:hypothetical protein
VQPIAHDRSQYARDIVWNLVPQNNALQLTSGGLAHTVARALRARHY